MTSSVPQSKSIGSWGQDCWSQRIASVWLANSLYVEFRLNERSPSDSNTRALS